MRGLACATWSKTTGPSQALGLHWNPLERPGRPGCSVRRALPLSYSPVVFDVLAAILAMVAVAAATAGLRNPPRARVLAGFSGVTAASALALVLLELGEPQLLLPVGLACLMLGVVLGTAREQRDDRARSDFQRHLARCRRRGENASVLVVALSDEVRMSKDAVEVLRMTDSAVIRRMGKRWELHALLDGDDVQRDVVEGRVRLALAASAPVFGWATFPADGLTLEALFEHARSATAGAVPATADRRAGASSAAPDDPARA